LLQRRWTTREIKQICRNLIDSTTPKIAMTKICSYPNKATLKGIDTKTRVKSWKNLAKSRQKLGETLTI
jgi:hypothetical protein